MHWLPLAFGAVLCFAAYDLLSRILGVKSKNPQAFSAVYNGVATLVAVLFYLFFPSGPSAVTPGLILLTIVGLFIWAIFGRLEWIAHKHIEASALTILERFAYIISFFAGIILLGETLTLEKGVSFVFIIAGIAVLSSGVHYRSAFHLSLLGIAVSVALGLGWVFDKVVSSAWGVSLFIIASFAAPTLFNALIPPIPLRFFLKEWQVASWRLFILGFLNVAGYYLMLSAFAVGELSGVILVIALTHAFTLLGGITILNEREDMGRKLVAGAFTFLAAILLGIAG